MTSIADLGAIGDGKTLNTKRIQAGIDQLASNGGGTLVVPQGIFLSGALFLKPSVHLYLEEGAVLKGSTDTEDYPERMTRIEGHFEKWLPALLNADQADGLRIRGSGILDGSGAPFWQEFWDRWKADPATTNLAVRRPRLMLIQNSEDVQIRGITFKDSGFWNLHLYRCRNVVVENARFETPLGVACPSTDGTDIDSCQNVTIRGCSYRVDDDCVCVKGSKGPFARDDKDSPPVEHIRVLGCTFDSGHGVVTLGSEATIVRDVVVEDCHVTVPVHLRADNPMPLNRDPIALVRLKLRPDTPQHYEDIHFRRITLEGVGTLLEVRRWDQFFDLQGQPPPHSIVRNLTLSNITGRFGSFGEIAGNPGQTEIRNISLENINVQLTDETLQVGEIQNLQIENVLVNGKPFSLRGNGVVK